MTIAAAANTSKLLLLLVDVVFVEAVALDDPAAAEEEDAEAEALDEPPTEAAEDVEVVADAPEAGWRPSIVVMFNWAESTMIAPGPVHSSSSSSYCTPKSDLDSPEYLPEDNSNRWTGCYPVPSE